MTKIRLHEAKTIMSETKNTPDGINNKMKVVEMTRELEDTAWEVMQNEIEQKKSINEMKYMYT